jgi:ankyrin repeat protein
MSAAESGHTEIVTILIEPGADINAITERWQTALMYAANYGTLKQSAYSLN